MLTLELLPEFFAVCQAPAATPPPPHIFSASWYSLTQTPAELSLVIRQDLAPAGWLMVDQWRCLKVQGTLDFSLVGILAGLSGVLATAGVSIFAVSTYATDYVLVQQKDIEQACEALETAGYHLLKP